MIENVRNDGDSTKEDPAEAGLMIGDLAVIVGRLAAMTEVLEISENIKPLGLRSTQMTNLNSI